MSPKDRLENVQGHVFPKSIPLQQNTGAAAVLKALEAAGITHLFVNLGSDHPAFLAEFVSRHNNKNGSLQIFTSPNEMNALSAASGFAQITGRPAAVLVHVECGTQGLAGAVHNVSKGRIPTLILAGTVPTTMEGELPGSRNEYIHWIQDVPDQRAIVRQYMRYEHEIRRAHNAPQIIFRALQYANSSPKGPSYVIASRETFEERVPIATSRPSQSYMKNQAVEPIGLTPEALTTLSQVLIASERPLIVTSYCGRSAEGFYALKELAECLSIPVHENAPIYNNFPTTNLLHQGHQWNGGGQLPALAEADVVLVIDADVPWIPAQSKPRDDARVFHLDNDVLKDGTPLWSLPCEGRWRCDSEVAMRQLTAAIRTSPAFSSPKTKDAIMSRKGMLQARFQARQRRLRAAEQKPSDGKLTAPYVMSRLRETTKQSGTNLRGLNEATTNLGNVADHLSHDHPLSLIGSGGGALGWYSGAAVGASMALRSLGQDRQRELFVAFVGDGTWLFGVPSCGYWMAQKYDTPYLTIVWNNSGWASPKNACLRLHPHKASEASATGAGVGEAMLTAIDPSPNFGAIMEGATAGNAWWRRVTQADEVDGILAEAIRQVLVERRCALVEIVLPNV